jgi:hypothetical protein
MTVSFGELGLVTVYTQKNSGTYNVFLRNFGEVKAFGWPSPQHAKYDAYEFAEKLAAAVEDCIIEEREKH